MPGLDAASQQGAVLVKRLLSKALALLFFWGPLTAIGQGAGERELFAQSSTTSKYAMILTGATVGQENDAKFRQLSLSLHDILAKDYGYSSAGIELLLSEPNADSRADGISDRQGIVTSLGRLREKLKTGDQLAVFLLGHGTGVDDEAKFNLRGPDLTGVEFARLFDDFADQDLIFVNTTSASYGFSTALAREVAGEGRIVVSATRSSSEKFDPYFPRYLIEGLADRRADRDKNSRVSLLEAFTYAKNNVEEFYEESGRLAAEHAGLDDNGDALFALAPAPGQSDGSLAEIAFIDAADANDDTLSAERLALKRRMQTLERNVLLLRGRKAEYLERDYWLQLETLLVDLAKTTEQFNVQAP